MPEDKESDIEDYIIDPSSSISPIPLIFVGAGIAIGSNYWSGAPPKDLPYLLGKTALNFFILTSVFGVTFSALSAFRSKDDLLNYAVAGTAVGVYGGFMTGGTMHNIICRSTGYGLLSTTVVVMCLVPLDVFRKSFNAALNQKYEYLHPYERRIPDSYKSSKPQTKKFRFQKNDSSSSDRE